MDGHWHAKKTGYMITKQMELLTKYISCVKFYIGWQNILRYSVVNKHDSYKNEISDHPKQTNKLRIHI